MLELIISIDIKYYILDIIGIIHAFCIRIKPIHTHANIAKGWVSFFLTLKNKLISELCKNNIDVANWFICICNLQRSGQI